MQIVYVDLPNEINKVDIYYLDKKITYKSIKLKIEKPEDNVTIAKIISA
jgi:hypothetical protein